MFKGLKSKLEDGAKKLQSNVQTTVSQYSDQLSQQFSQIGSGASEAGSDTGSTSRYFSSHDTSNNLSYSVGNALMEEVTEADLLGLDGERKRRDSGGSNHSNESLSALFASVPGLTSVSIEEHREESDRESTIGDSASTVASSASKEQISSILNKLQFRASNYRERYHDLVKKYNEVVTENNKCRSVLQKTQDTALTKLDKLRKEKKALSEKIVELSNGDSQTESRAAKLEEMLEKCKGEILRNRKKIQELSEENEAMKAVDGKDAVSEWKDKLEKTEAQWTERLNKAETDATILLATTKADMHAALEGKDREVESLRKKCRDLEIQDGQANDRWQKKVDEATETIKALEAEKEAQRMMLTEANKTGVKAVLEEEEKKRAEMEKTFEEEKQKITQEYENRIKQIEHTKNVESSAEKSEEDDEKEEQIKELTNNTRHLQDKLSELEERRKAQVSELEEALDSQKTKHKAAIAELMKEHEEIVANVREQSETQQKAVEERLELVRQEVEQLRAAGEDADAKMRSLVGESSANSMSLQAQLNETTATLERTERTLDETERRAESATQELSSLRDKLLALEREQAEVAERLAQECEKNEELSASASSENVRFEEELEELRGMLNERNATVKKMEEERQALQIELANAKELSAMHEHLRVELEDAREARDAVESKLFELEERAKQAERALQDDRRELEELRATAAESVHGAQADENNLISIESSEETVIRELRAQLETLQAENLRLSSELCAEKEESRHLEEARTGLDKELATINATLAELQDCVERQHREHDVQIDKYKQEMTIIREQKNLLEDEVKAGKEKIELLEEANEQCNLTIDEMNNEKATLDSVNKEKDEKWNARVEDLSKQMAELKQQLVDANKNSLQANETANQYLATIGELEKREKELVERVEKKEEEEKQKKADEERIHGDNATKEQEKERILSDLRGQLEGTESARKALQEEVNQLRDQLQEITQKAETADAKAEEVERKMKEELERAEKRRKEEEEEAKKIRDQYASALATVKEQLEKNTKEEEEMRKMKEKLEKELEECKENGQEEKTRRNKEHEEAIELVRKKAAAKLAKAKSEKESEVAAAKAELLLEVDALRDQIRAMERDADAARIHAAQLEQRLIGEEQQRISLEGERNRNRELSSRVDELDRRVMECDAARASAEDTASKAENARRELEETLASAKQTVQEQAGKILELESQSEEALNKAVAKRETDKQRVIRELQKEVKQLYSELNEKSAAHKETLEKLKRLEAEAEENQQKKTVTPTALPPADYIGEEEVSALKNRLGEAHREVEELRQINDRMQKNLQEKAKKTRTESDSYDAFAEPTEAEYLRNVLFRYMNDRETVGKEIVTLARVIGTVAKFTPPQLESVIAKEETRANNWTIPPVSSVLSHTVASTRH